MMINNTIYIYRYEDVALFKSGVINEACQDPLSQVSSSTDSGYGHGAHIYERIADFNHNKHSGMELTLILSLCLSLSLSLSLSAFPFNSLVLQTVDTVMVLISMNVSLTLTTTNILVWN